MKIYKPYSFARLYPLILFTLLFLLPNFIGEVISPALDIIVLALYAISSYFLCPLSPVSADQPGLIANTNRKFILLAVVIIAVAFAKNSAIYQSLINGGFEESIRESSLKLAGPFVAIGINIMRDGIVPFLILAELRDGCKRRRRMGILIALYIFFSMFNMAKSFIIVNTIALLVAVGVNFYWLVLFASVFCISFLFYALELRLINTISIETAFAFYNDFFFRRILTLTPQLGVEVREYVFEKDFYWFHNFPQTNFEYLFFDFLKHSPNPTGWANVYFAADAYARGGPAASFIALFLCIIYLLFFRSLTAWLGSTYCVYATTLFTTYVYMQGVFSLGLATSFLMSPLLLCLFSRPRVKQFLPLL